MPGGAATHRLKPEGFRLSTLTLVSGTLAISLLSLALPIATVQIYDRVLPNQSWNTLAVLTVGVGVVIVLEATLRLSRAWLIGFSGAAYVHRLSCDAMRHVLAADLSRQRGEGGRIDFQNVSAIRGMKDFHSGHSMTTMLELILAPVYLVLIAYIGGLLFLAPATLLVIFTIISLSNGRALRQALSEREASDHERYMFLIGSLHRAHTVKALAQEQHLLRRYERHQARSCATNFDVSNALTNSFNTSAVFSHLMIACTVGFGAIAVIEEMMSVGALIAVVLLSGRLMQPIQRALMLWARYQSYDIAKRTAERLFDAPLVQEDERADTPPADGALDVEELSFAYDDDAPPLLDRVSLTLRRGQAISIAGAPGCGATTFLKLIVGLHRPVSGKVLIDGLEATRYPPGRLNQHVGYMAAEGVIFRGTIRDNITRFGDVSLAQAMGVAELLGMEQEFAKLPAGLDTMLEGGGADSLPPGVKQRIALIRVLATRPKILLFDNADRSLDLEGYNMVHNLLGRLKRKASMIIVSDDENLRQLADRHYELEGGALYELKSERAELLGSRRSRSVRL